MRSVASATCFGTKTAGGTDVGALTMTVDATAVAQEGWDMRMDYIKTRGSEPPPPAMVIPEPTSVLLLGAGLIALARRLRSA